MKKNIFVYIFILIFTSSNIFATTAKENFLNDVFQSFINIVDVLATDYSSITGLYTTSGELRGSASVGEFPAFRAGATAGVVFFRDPVRFLKQIKFYNANWDSIHDSLSSVGTAIDGFDSYFLPIPITNFHFHVGLPFGMTVGMKFHVMPLGNFVNSVSGTFLNDYNLNVFSWGIGTNFTYTILKEHKKFPTISVTFGIDYSDTNIGIDNISIGNINLDASNDAVPTYIGFNTHNNNLSFYLDFSISKRIKFFQPFFSMRVVQTITHNVAKMAVDLEGLTADAKSTYESNIEVSNVTTIDQFDNQIGVIIPVTDFIINLGFEFVIKIFRLGINGSFSAASQTGMVTIGMRFHIENWQFRNIKQAWNNKNFKLGE